MLTDPWEPGASDSAFESGAEIEDPWAEPPISELALLTDPWPARPEPEVNAEHSAADLNVPADVDAPWRSAEPLLPAP